MAWNKRKNQSVEEVLNEIDKIKRRLEGHGVHYGDPKAKSKKSPNSNPDRAFRLMMRYADLYNQYQVMMALMRKTKVGTTDETGLGHLPPIQFRHG